MASYFCSSNYKRLVLVSYDSLFLTKYFKMIFIVSLVYLHTNGMLFFTYISTGPFKGL